MAAVKLAHDYAAQARAASGSNFLLGSWLLGSAWIFDYGGKAAASSSVIAGALVALLALSRLAWPNRSAWLSGINLVLAFWTIYSPWAYGFTGHRAALADNLVCGVSIAALAIRSATASDRSR
jgi:hypothetical protein